MNLKNLNTLIDRYFSQMDWIYNEEHNELFKWKAVQYFQKVWHAPENQSLSFAEKFNKAKKESAVLIDNSRISPSMGVVKLAQVAENEVSSLFFDVLLADDGGDISLRQNHMDAFLEGMEKLRVQYFPQCWKYKQDRHAASCYLCFFAPDTNFIYHYTEVEAFAQNIEYGIDIGSGERFRLAAYYKMCDEVVDALKSHPDLLSRQAEFLKNDAYYKDPALHLLAFNLIWCTYTYHFDHEIFHKTKKEALKAYAAEQRREKEQAQREADVRALQEQIQVLTSELEPYREISLLDVQVTDKRTGAVGTIVAQDGNKITVQYETGQKNYMIHKKYSYRPCFEDDEEIVEAFTAYDTIQNQLHALKKQLSKLLL